jgi:hypothetical protein
MGLLASMLELYSKRHYEKIKGFATRLATKFLNYNKHLQLVVFI